MLSCQQVTHLLSQDLDRRLAAAERLRLRAHLAVCDACGRLSRQFQFLRKAIRKIGNPGA